MTMKSMTGFATQEVTVAGQVWVWELRSLNARGLDLKMRLPEGADRFEATIRERVGTGLKRGAVQITLRRVGRDGWPLRRGPSNWTGCLHRSPRCSRRPRAPAWFSTR